MDKFKFFTHTADAKFQAFGHTLEEAFGHAALAVASLMWDRENIMERIAIPVEHKGKDLEQLLANFLEEILYLLDTKNFLLGSVSDISIRKETERWKVEAIFKGAVNAGEYEIFGDVKAVTYHEMEIVSSHDRWSIQVVVDM